MKIGLITQIRDEIDIVETFVRHVDSLFDVVFFIDHQSIDGSGEYLKSVVSQRPGWKYYKLESKTKLQMAAINLLLHEAFYEGVDYLFLLDADEFINVQSRAALEHMIQEKLLPHSLGSLKWINCISNTFSDANLTPDTKLWVPPESSRLDKVVLTRKFYDEYKNNFKVSAGNHCVMVAENLQLPENTVIGNIIHVPIRSRMQVIKKVLTTVIAYRGYKKREPTNSFQYYEMLKKISDGKMSDDDLRGYTLGFESPGKINLGITKADLRRLGYRQSSLNKLNLSFSKDLPCEVSKISILLERKLASALLDLENDLPEDVHLEIDGNALRIVNEEVTIADLPKTTDANDRNLELSNRINALETEIAVYKNEIMNYENSESWKITKPIRVVTRFLKRKHHASR